MSTISPVPERLSSAPNPPAGAVPRTPTLELRSTSRWYGNVVAINDVSFALGPGITGLLGANGAGKTTILHLAAGLLRPSSGEVRVEGAGAWRNPTIYRSVALVPERETVYSFLTAYEFALASARLHDLPDPAAAAARAIHRVDLEAAQHRRMSTYSKGMRQRAKIAAALVHDPRLLLLDEPFNGLDPTQRLQTTELLRMLADQGATVVFSTHILEEIDHIADDVLVLVAGRLAASGEPREIRKLMTHRPHTFRVVSSDNRRLAATIVGHESVVGVELTGGGLIVRASNRGAFIRALPACARDHGISVFELLPTDESLENVFSYLVRS